MSEPKYSEAMAELEEIVNAIENDTPDPDELIVNRSLESASAFIEGRRKNKRKN